MYRDFNLGQGFEFESNIPNYVELNELNEFEEKKDNLISDEEFNDLLIELGIINSSENESLDNKKESEKDFEAEKKLAYSKLKVEWDILNYEKAKLKREKEEWEKFKKLSEESFRAEKKDFENLKQNEMKKMYLETRKLIDSCTNLKEFLEKYEEIQDVSE